LEFAIALRLKTIVRVPRVGHKLSDSKGFGSATFSLFIIRIIREIRGYPFSSSIPMARRPPEAD
jgi:hypothetical protein